MTSFRFCLLPVPLTVAMHIVLSLNNYFLLKLHLRDHICINDKRLFIIPFKNYNSKKSRKEVFAVQGDTVLLH